MPGPVSIIPPLLVAAVLIVSGIAKLRHPDDLTGWADLGVPKLFRRAWLLRLHPWGEIALGVALLVLGGILGTLAALAALALMAGYLVFVAAILRAGTDASCACFGARKRITTMTAVRNGWYVLLSAIGVATAWTNPLWGGPLAAINGEQWLWVCGLAAAGVTVGLTMWAAPAVDAPTDSARHDRATDDDELLDYLRVRTPSVPVALADGEVVSLRELAAREPLLLLAVRPGCSPCQGIYERLPDMRALLPEVSIRLLLTGTPEESAWTETEPASVHDPKEYVRDSIEEWRTPTAVLFGVDGMLAGGPVTGNDRVLEFIDDVYESLHGERPPRPLSTN